MDDEVRSFFESAYEDITVDGMSVADLDQHITMWRNDLANAGVDVTDPVILECIAVFTFRLLSLIVSIAEYECDSDEMEHFAYHVQSGAAPAVLLIHSALRTYGCS